MYSKQVISAVRRLPNQRRHSRPHGITVGRTATGHPRTSRRRRRPNPDHRTPCPLYFSYARNNGTGRRE